MMELFNSLLVAIVALLLITSASAQTCPSPNGLLCSDEGACLTFLDSTTACACASGQFGIDCGSAADVGCTYNSVASLETANIPLAVTADYTNDTLTVVLTSPLVSERTSTNIMIDAGGEGDANCTYPGNYWTRDVVDCADQFTGAMPWLDTRGCGWLYDDSDPEYYVYTANMIVEHHDLIYPFAGRNGSSPVDRLTTHMVPIEVQFQKYVDVSTNITVSAPITILAAITKQTVDPATKIAVIEVTTNALHPYYLTEEVFSLTPSYPGYIYTIEEVGDPALCPNDPNVFCLQVFRITIDASTGCEISGDYTLNLGIVCKIDDATSSPWSSCAVNANAAADIDLVILSKDFCAKVTTTIDITGSLESYQDSDNLVPKTTFLNDQVVYFRANIDSPDANLTSATVTSVRLVSGAETIQLYLDSAFPVADAEFALGLQGATTADFFFTLRASFITGIDPDSVKDYQVIARVDVTFEGVPGVKRMIFQSPIDSREMAVSSLIGVENTAIQNEPFEESSASSSSVFGVLAFTVVSVIVML